VEENFDHKEDCPIKNEHGRDPTPAECGVCEHLEDSTMAAYFRSYPIFEQLQLFANTETSQWLFGLLDSDQFFDLMQAIKMMCVFFDPQMAHLARAGLELDLSSVITNAFVIGYMTRMESKFGDLSHNKSKNNEIEEFLAEILKKEDTNGDTPDTTPA